MPVRSYDELLKRALQNLPLKPTSGERFVMPTVDLEVIGHRTILYNFKEICEKLNRDPQHLIRFLAKELATAGSYAEPRLNLQGKFNKSGLDSLIERYTKTFVICPTCGRPDTVIVKEGRYNILQCEACGAKAPILTV